MTTRYSYLILAIAGFTSVALTGSVAYADSSSPPQGSAQAPSPAPSPAAPAPTAAPAPAAPAPAEANPRDRFTGTYAYVGGDKEIAAKDAAIEKATDSMFFATRGFARSKLRDRTEVRKTIGFAFSNGNIIATAAGTAPAVSPETGASAPYKTNDGATATLSQKLTADGRITQTFTADGGSRTATFTLSADGKTITAHYTINSSKLPQPVHYALTYRRS